MKLLKPFALALLLPNDEKADCPKAEVDPGVEDAPNAGLLVAVAEAPNGEGEPNAGLLAAVADAPSGEGDPKTEGAPNTGLDDPVGVLVLGPDADRAGGVPPNALVVVGVFGGLKNGEFEGVVDEPKAPNPDCSFPKPIGEAVRFENAPPLGAGVAGLSGDGEDVAAGVLGTPKAEVVFGGGVAGCEGALKTDVVAGLSSASLDSVPSFPDSPAVDAGSLVSEAGALDFAAWAKDGEVPANAANPPDDVAVF